MSTTSVRFSSIAALGGLLAGCMVGPDYHRPSAPVPAQYKEQLSGWTSAAPADAKPKGDWWTDFHDPLLDQLEPMVAVSNQTVRQDFANYQQALAEVKVARSQLFPTLGLAGSVTRSGGPGNSAGAAATAQADEAILANATLSEQTLLATTIIQLRVADADIDLQSKTVESLRESLAITEHQAEAGVSTAPPSAVITARVAVESAQAALIGLGVARAQYAHSIAVLVGKNPEELDIPHSTVMPTLPTVPSAMPSTLLQRRPDIAAAERTVKAQNAAVGIAVAAYYPTISLSGEAGFSQAPLNGLLHTANHVWSIGASGTETLLDFGERHGEVAAAKAAYEAAVASYRNTVLSAFQDVENDLSGLRILAEQAQALDVAVRDATRGTQIALAEFQAGTVDYTTVAQAQEAQFGDQQNALGVQQSRLLEAVSLIGDLGGGWSDAQLHDAVHPKKPAPAAESGAGAP